MSANPDPPLRPGIASRPRMRFGPGGCDRCNGYVGRDEDRSPTCFNCGATEHPQPVQMSEDHRALAPRPRKFSL